MFHETSDSEKTLLGNITIASQEDIQEDKRHRSSLHRIIGGQEYKPTSESTLMDARLASKPRPTRKKPITPYIHLFKNKLVFIGRQVW
jgi:hypothetical protein